MPDAQGTSSFIGGFLQGFMRQSAQAEDEKLRKVAGMMQIADHHRKMAENPDIDEAIRKDAERSYTKYVQDADKLMNQKVSGLGALMSIFGIGKKGKDGQPAPIPSELFQPQRVPTNYPAEPSAGGLSSIPYFLDNNPPGVSSPNADPGFTPRPAPFSAPQPVASTTGTELLSYRTPVDTLPGYSTVIAPPPVDRFAGMNAIAAQNLMRQEAENKLKLENAIATARATGEVSQGFARENAKWQSDFQRQQNLKSMNEFLNGPIARQMDPELRTQVATHIGYGITPPNQTPRIKETSEDGMRVIRDLNSGKVLHQYPEPETASERAAVKDYMLANPGWTEEQARTALAKTRVEARTTANEAKDLALQRTRLLNEYTQSRMKWQNETKAGKLDIAKAKSLHQEAMNWGLRNFNLDSRRFGATKEQADAIKAQYAREYIEGNASQPGVGVTWEQLNAIISGQAPRTPQEEANSLLTPRNPAANKKPTILLPPKK